MATLQVRDLPDEVYRQISYLAEKEHRSLTQQTICREVFAESIKNRHPSYDLFYLIVARRHNAAILSIDKKMKSIAREMKIKIAL